MDWQTFVSTMVGGIAGSILTLIVAKEQFKRDDLFNKEQHRKSAIQELEKLNFVLGQIKLTELPLALIKESKDQAVVIAQNIIDEYELAHSAFFKVLIVINDSNVTTNDVDELYTASQHLREQSQKFKHSLSMFSDEDISNPEAFYRSKLKLDNFSRELSHAVAHVLKHSFKYESHFEIK